MKTSEFIKKLYEYGDKTIKVNNVFSENKRGGYIVTD